MFKCHFCSYKTKMNYRYNYHCYKCKLNPFNGVSTSAITKEFNRNMEGVIMNYIYHYYWTYFGMYYFWRYNDFTDNFKSNICQKFYNKIIKSIVIIQKRFKKKILYKTITNKYKTTR